MFNSIPSGSEPMKCLGISRVGVVAIGGAYDEIHATPRDGSETAKILQYVSNLLAFYSLY